MLDEFRFGQIEFFILRHESNITTCPMTNHWAAKMIFWTNGKPTARYLKTSPKLIQQKGCIFQVWPPFNKHSLVTRWTCKINGINSGSALCVGPRWLNQIAGRVLREFKCDSFADATEADAACDELSWSHLKDEPVVQWSQSETRVARGWGRWRWGGAVGGCGWGGREGVARPLCS